MNSRTIKIIATFYNFIFFVSVVLFFRQEKRRSKRILTRKIFRFLFFEFVFDFCFKKTTITNTKKTNLTFFCTTTIIHKFNRFWNETRKFRVKKRKKNKNSDSTKKKKKHTRKNWFDDEFEFLISKIQMTTKNWISNSKLFDDKTWNLFHTHCHVFENSTTCVFIVVFFKFFDVFSKRIKLNDYDIFFNHENDISFLIRKNDTMFLFFHQHEQNYNNKKKRFSWSKQKTKTIWKRKCEIMQKKIETNESIKFLWIHYLIQSIFVFLTSNRQYKFTEIVFLIRNEIFFFHDQYAFFEFSFHRLWSWKNNWLHSKRFEYRQCDKNRWQNFSRIVKSWLYVV